MRIEAPRLTRRSLSATDSRSGEVAHARARNVRRRSHASIPRSAVSAVDRLGSSGGPERRTDVVLLASGHEERNSRWADSRRRYNAGTGVHSLADLHTLIGFFEERRGQLYGFRWRDRGDWKSCAPERHARRRRTRRSASATARPRRSSSSKTYGSGFAPYQRKIAKPVEGTVRIAVDGNEQTRGRGFFREPRDGCRHVSGRARSGRGRGRHRRLRVRRAGPLRHRPARHQPRVFRRRGKRRTCRWWRSRVSEVANGE